ATLIRVGNHRYARDNRSYGLTTLRARHVDVNGSRIRFRFKGKSGIEHDVSLEHPRLARVLRRCLELPGQDVLQYLD
ncbi:DNA topoisomerase IB, partial [Pseudomonas aeruginosa]